MGNAKDTWAIDWVTFVLVFPGKFQYIPAMLALLTMIPLLLSKCPGLDDKSHSHPSYRPLWVDNQTSDNLGLGGLKTCGKS